MTPREFLGSAAVPGGQELMLYRRGSDFMIVLDRNELMSSRMSGSEKALALMTIERLAGRKAPHLLIGGYGMGFTLRAALGVLGQDARITLAELVPEIIDWARGPMAELANGCLDDPRVDLMMGDVVPVIAAGRACYDAILLDVDNGPDGLTAAANDRLYSATGLAAAPDLPSMKSPCARATMARGHAMSSGLHKSVEHAGLKRSVQPGHRDKNRH
mgnify:CR=1 FL=1